jgi:hypothetical protein
MEEAMRDFGKMGNSAEKENIFFQMERKKWENGIKGIV